MKDKPNNAFDFAYESVSKILWFCNTALRDTFEIAVSTLYEPIMAFSILWYRIREWVPKGETPSPRQHPLRGVATQVR